MGNGVVFAPKFDFELAEMSLGLLEACSIGAESEVPNGDELLAGRGLRVDSGGTLDGEESEHGVVARRHHGRHIAPNVRMHALQPQHLGIPRRRSGDVPDGESEVVEGVEVWHNYDLEG